MLEQPSGQKRTFQLALAAVAAFCTYFCMYAFRKPFTAATYAGQELFGAELKAILVTAQLAGYMASKFIGIKIVSEMKSHYRAVTIVGLILFAEAALVGFAYMPTTVKPVMLFFNGLPLGMVFGLVLAYLEGRKQTEALSATLCASFIISSGVVKSVGQWLVLQGVSEFQMPMVTGLIFLPPLLISVWLLQKTPAPVEEDRQLRSERETMTRDTRRSFVAAYWPGLALFVLVYMALTLIRSLRDDYGLEIWESLGVKEKPSIFTTSETIVAVFVTSLAALAIVIRNNLRAMRVTLALMCAGFGLVLAATLTQSAGYISPLAFMVLCGIGLYIPYVAFHTSLFERLIAASRRPCNLGFLMYLADAMGYLAYVGLLVFKPEFKKTGALLSFFRLASISVAILSLVALLVSVYYFHRVLTNKQPTGTQSHQQEFATADASALSQQHVSSQQ